MKKIKLYLFFPVSLLLYTFVFLTDKNGICSEDLVRWSLLYSFSSRYGLVKFCWFFSNYPEYRSVLYSRKRILKYLIGWIIKPQKNLFIYTTNISGGLFIQHGFATVIAAKSIGANCWVNQQVTIGYTSKGAPTIGNNVRIGAGAIVIGNITIGDNCTIAAGTVVNFDVPSNSLVVGQKSRIVENHVVLNQ